MKQIISSLSYNLSARILLYFSCMTVITLKFKPCLRLFASYVAAMVLGIGSKIMNKQYLAPQGKIKLTKINTNKYKM